MNPLDPGFSSNLAADTAFGAALLAIFALGTPVLALLSWLYLSDRLDRVGRGPPPWVSAGGAVIALLLPMVGVGWLASLAVLGDIGEVWVRGEGEPSVVRVQFRWRSGGRVSTARHGLGTFDVGGRRLGWARRSGGVFSPRTTSVAHVGPAELVRRGERYLLLDADTLTQVVDVDEALTERFGASGYRVRDAAVGGLEVELRDGTIERVDLHALLPAPMRARSVEPWRVLREGCRATAAGEQERRSVGDHESEVPGLLRARTVRRGGHHAPCELRVDGRALVVLHRDTAFGEEGRHLRSLVDAPTRVPRWTADLEPLMSDGSRVKPPEVLDPRRVDERICLWLIRAGRSLSELCVDAQTGATRSHRVLF